MMAMKAYVWTCVCVCMCVRVCMCVYVCVLYHVPMYVQHCTVHCRYKYAVDINILIYYFPPLNRTALYLP